MISNLKEVTASEISEEIKDVAVVRSVFGSVITDVAIKAKDLIDDDGNVKQLDNFGRLVPGITKDIAGDARTVLLSPGLVNELNAGNKPKKIAVVTRKATQPYTKPDGTVLKAGRTTGFTAVVA